MSRIAAVEIQSLELNQNDLETAAMSSTLVSPYTPRKGGDGHGSSGAISDMKLWIENFPREPKVAEHDGGKLITIFGSAKPVNMFKENPDASYIKFASNGVRAAYNWARLGDKIGAMMFSENGEWRGLAASLGIRMNSDFEIHAEFKRPTYRGLFSAALRETRSELIGFSNGDILYGRGLVRFMPACMISLLSFLCDMHRV